MRLAGIPIESKFYLVGNAVIARGLFEYSGAAPMTVRADGVTAMMGCLQAVVIGVLILLFKVRNKGVPRV
jgi:hypothetical protein